MTVTDCFLVFFATLSCSAGLNVRTQPNPLANSLSAVSTEFQHLRSAMYCGQPQPIPILDTRDDLGYLLEMEKKQTGVEVGVQAGVFAKIMLSRWSSAKMYHLVDLWAQQEHYDDTANVHDAAQADAMQAAQTNLKEWKNTTHFMKMPSLEAAKTFEDNSLDFVYLDARHDYPSVKADIAAWWPKLKSGGILSGHDFEDASVGRKEGNTWKLDPDGNESPKYDAPELGPNGKGIQAAVRAAVLEFSKATGRQAVTTRRESSSASWMLRK